MSALIFLNYRRSDSAGWTRQLHRDLGERFGGERVFRDVAIAPGVDFVDHIERVMDACKVCIAVIGPQWTHVTNAAGLRRLDDPEDLVRLEIERALERTDVQVIPVLVDGARMPAEHDLPSGLRRLARRNACELTDVRWDYDVEVLSRCIRQAVEPASIESEPYEAAPSIPPPALPPEPVATPVAVLPAVLATLTAAAIARVLAALVTLPLNQANDDLYGTQHLAPSALERGILWAIVGAAVAAVAAATFAHVRVPVGQALVGASAAGIGGALSGSILVALTELGPKVDLSPELATAMRIWLPAVALAVVLARGTQASAVECTLAALAGVAIASLVPDFGGSVAKLFVQVVRTLLIVGAPLAVIAARPQRATLTSRETTRRGPAAA